MPLQNVCSQWKGKFDTERKEKLTIATNRKEQKHNQR